MKFILRQILPPTRREKPIEIYLTKNLTVVGKKCQNILNQFSQISRFHASFYKSEDNTLFVKNLNNVNGLYINDEKVETPLKLLQLGDVIGFGVTSAEKDAGFVCIVCSDDNPYKAKSEVVDISNDEVPQTNSILVSNSGKNTISSVSEREVFPYHATLKLIPAQNLKTSITDNHPKSYRETSYINPKNIEIDCSKSNLNETKAESSQCKNLNIFPTVKSSNDNTLNIDFKNTENSVSVGDLQNKNIERQNNLVKFSQSEKETEQSKMSQLNITSSLCEVATNSCDPNISKNVNTTIKFESNSENTDKDFLTSIHHYIANFEKILHKDSFSKKKNSETYENKDVTNTTSNVCEILTFPTCKEFSTNSDADIMCLESDEVGIAESTHTEKSNSQKRQLSSCSSAESLASKFSTFKKRCLTNEKGYIQNNFSNKIKKNSRESTSLKINQSGSDVETCKRLIQNMKQNNIKSFELKSRLIKNVLHFNTKWLVEQDEIRYPPPFISTGVEKLPLNYNSIDSYISSFYPMLMLEIWEQMYSKSKEVLQTEKHFKEFYFTIVSYTVKIDFIELKCEASVSEKNGFIPCEDSVVILEIGERSNSHTIFGHVFKLKSEPLNLNDHNLLNWKSVLEKGLTDVKHWSFHINIKKREISFPLNTLMKGNGLCCIQNELKLIDALSYLKHSPLMTDFLKPKWKTFSVKYSAVSATREFNSKQMEVIECVTSEIIKSKREPKIILLQGPPATGKTHTIIGLIRKFLTVNNFNSNCKILVTALSNAAVDEIGCRLIDLNEKLQPKGIIKFARVGTLKEMHPKMKKFSLDRKASSSQPECKPFKEELKNLVYERTKLFEETFNIDRCDRQKYFKDKCDNQTEDCADRNWKCSILKDSHVILTTLKTCGLPLLLNIFKPNSDAQFSFCIVDDSTQCTELEILQPLMLNIRKLILVGDYKQLPINVSSKTARKYGFKTSTFERLHAYFQVYYKKTPVFTLSEQFRMHSSICKFPSKVIYDRKLITNPSTDKECNNFPIKPYVVLDVQDNSENKDLSKVICGEIQVVLSVCSMLMDYTDDLVTSIGIITLNKTQQALYLEKLHSNPQYNSIEVNTVDNFQGREKDIIIVSTVKANDKSDKTDFLASKETLSVVLTRARKCLIICACSDSLKNFTIWAELILDAKKRNVCFPVTCPKDMSTVFEHMRKKK